VPKSTVGRERADAVVDVPKPGELLWLEKLSLNIEGLAVGVDAGSAGAAAGVVGTVEL